MCTQKCDIVGLSVWSPVKNITHGPVDLTHIVCLRSHYFFKKLRHISWDVIGVR